MQHRIAVILPAVLVAVAACNSKTESKDPGDVDYAARMATEHRTDTPSASPAAESSPGAPIKSQTVQYATINGHTVQGYLAYPASAEGGLPAVLVFHEWWGLNDNIKAMTNQLAGQGYVALAADLYAGRVADRPEAARSYMEQALQDREGLTQNLRQAHAYLKEHIKATRVGTIGWCFGGGISLRAGLELADQVDAVVVYYGHVPGEPEELKGLQAPLLGLFGEADTGIPIESVRQFEKALASLGKNARIEVYPGAAHAFANPSGGNYQPQAAADAWEKTLSFLATHLKGG